MIGRHISHYRIVERLGSGGMGTVWRAEDTLLDRPVALKFLHPSRGADETARARLLREAKSAAVLDHPNIVVVYDAGEVEGEVFIVLQCVEGASLRARLDRGPLPFDQALNIGRAVANALAHAHGRGILHRDVKPENVLLGGDGQVRVADFGLALPVEETRLTTQDAVVGTLRYIAPEVLEGAEPDGRSDLYALGVTLHEMFAGTSPFTGAGPAAVIWKTVHEPPPSLPAALPAALRTLVGSLMEKRPDRRPATAIDVADALERISRGGSVEEGSPSSGRSVAVLPFENLTGDPQDAPFCAGITEDLLTDLQRIPDLRIASRGRVESLGPGRPDARQAGQALGVATLLYGSVRRARSRVRVNAQLVRTDSGYQIWAERYDRELADLFEVQEDISRSIATALRVALAPEDADTRLGRRTRNPRAYDLRARAMTFYRRSEAEEMRQAVESLEQAILEDPDYALAHAELAECCVQFVCKGWDSRPAWLDRAEQEIARALSLAPGLPEAYRARGHALNHRRRMREALRDLHHAVELDPHFGDGLNNLAVNYLYLGDPGRAETYARRAVEAEPDDTRSRVTLGEVLLRLGRPEEARRGLERLLEARLGPSRRLLVFALVTLACSRDGHPDHLRRLGDMVRGEYPPSHAGARQVAGLAAALAGDDAEARRLLGDVQDTFPHDNFVLTYRARAWLKLGEPDHALAALERAAAFDVLDLDELRRDEAFAPLQGDPRFERLFTLQS